MPRLKADFGSRCARKSSSAGSWRAKLCVLSERSPSRNAGHRRSDMGFGTSTGGIGIVDTATNVSATP